MPNDLQRQKIRAEAVRLLTVERKRQRISGNSLAKKTGLSQSGISSLETDPGNPTLDTLQRIAEALNVDLGEIITRATKNVQKLRSSAG